MSCYYENPDCLAVNVITRNDVIRCEMTTGLSNETDMVNDSTYVLYVSGKLNFPKSILLRGGNFIILKVLCGHQKTTATVTQ